MSVNCPKCGAKSNVFRPIQHIGGGSSLHRIGVGHSFANGFSCLICGYYADAEIKPMELTMKQFKVASPSAVASNVQDFAIQHFDELDGMNKSMGWDKVTQAMNEKYGVKLFYQTLRKYHTAEKLKRKLSVDTGRTARRA